MFSLFETNMVDLSSITALDEQTLNKKVGNYYIYGQLILLFHEHCPQFKASLEKGGRVKSVSAFISEVFSKNEFASFVRNVCEKMNTIQLLNCYFELG